MVRPFPLYVFGGRTETPLTVTSFPAKVERWCQADRHRAEVCVWGGGREKIPPPAYGPALPRSMWTTRFPMSTTTDLVQVVPLEPQGTFSAVTVKAPLVSWARTYSQSPRKL